jgi:hypothetical protein
MTLVEVYFVDSARRPELFDGTHQVLMTSSDHAALSHGTQVTTLKYDEIQEIRIKFKGDV